MIVLDTNVISELMRVEPERRVIGWLNQRPAESIWTTSVSIFEIRFGLASMAKGKRQRGLATDFDALLNQDLQGRVLDFDAAAAEQAALIAAKLRSDGRPVEIRDVFIAGIVTARHGILATRNTKHFEFTDVPMENPWETESV